MRSTLSLLPPQKIANSDSLAPIQFSVKDTARMLDYSKRTVERMIKRGELISVGRYKLRRVPLSSILAWQEKHLNEVL